MRDSGPNAFYGIFVRSLDYNPTTDLPFLLATNGGRAQRLVSSASFEPEESICPGRALADGRPAGPLNASWPT